jgi:hypothetical protein
MFSAVEPSLAISAYLARTRKLAEQDFTEQARAAAALAKDLDEAYSEALKERGTCGTSASPLPEPGGGERRILFPVREGPGQLLLLAWSQPPADPQLARASLQGDEL